METTHKFSLILGAMIGAILGLGATYLLIKAPSDLEEDDPNPLSAGDLIKFTSAAALFIRQLDDFRRRL